MGLDRGADHRAVKTLRAALGIVAAHHALEFRELADHAGDEIRLAEQTGGFRLIYGACIRPQRPGDLPGQAGNPIRTVPLSADFGVEGDFFELR